MTTVEKKVRAGEAGDSEAARRERAAARSGRILLRRTQLQDVEADLTPLRGEEAVSLVQDLTRESWALSGEPEPSYTRQAIPCRFVPHVRG
jgi:hypothetical protein